MSMIFVANWKMQMPYNNAIAFYTQHSSDLQKLSDCTNSTLVLCPSCIALAPLASLAKNSSIKIGAQHCSTYSTGPYTGQIDALSLAQAGCSYALVGHSETRHIMRETAADLIGQITQLTANNIIPIICIGETAAQQSSQTRREALKTQLESLKPILAQKLPTPYIIAYEPLWAIGTGLTPCAADLSDIHTYIRSTITQIAIHPSQALLYGGSVNPDTIEILASANCFDGYLIGSASLDFQTLKKIVSWATRVV